jgi:hypothetical protein
LALVAHGADLVDRALLNIAEVLGGQKVLDLRHDVRVPLRFGGS